MDIHHVTPLSPANYTARLAITWSKPTQTKYQNELFGETLDSVYLGMTAWCYFLWVSDLKGKNFAVKPWTLNPKFNPLTHSNNHKSMTTIMTCINCIKLKEKFFRIGNSAHPYFGMCAYVCFHRQSVCVLMFASTGKRLGWGHVEPILISPAFRQCQRHVHLAGPKSDTAAAQNFQGWDRCTNGYSASDLQGDWPTCHADWDKSGMNAHWCHGLQEAPPSVQQTFWSQSSNAVCLHWL